MTFSAQKVSQEAHVTEAPGEEGGRCVGASDLSQLQTFLPAEVSNIANTHVHWFNLAKRQGVECLTVKDDVPIHRNRTKVNEPKSKTRTNKLGQRDSESTVWADFSSSSSNYPSSNLTRGMRILSYAVVSVTFSTIKHRQLLDGWCPPCLFFCILEFRSNTAGNCFHNQWTQRRQQKDLLPNQVNPFWKGRDQLSEELETKEFRG